jgi:drug/metabolite transporter (DMT)-like permease
MSDDIKRKLTSRKFWLAVAAFLGSIGSGIAGLATQNETVAGIGIVCAMLSAAIYAAAESVVDAANASANTTATTKAVALTGNATKANLEQVS